MLVDTSCEDQCDWQRLTEEPYVFSSEQEFSYDEMFVRDVALDSPGDTVTLAQFMKYSCQPKGTIEAPEEDNWCSLPGCCIPFPAEPHSNAQNGWSFKYERGRKTIWHAKRLCWTHYKRLKDLHARKDFAALDRFHNALCDAEKACLAPDLEQLLLNFPGSATHKRANLSYERIPGSVKWALNGRRLCAILSLSERISWNFPRSSQRAEKRAHTRQDS